LKTDPKQLGHLTLSILRGQDGHQTKEIEKLLAWLRTEPPYDVIILPNALLIALARPLARELGRPVLCTLQGEDLFLDGLDETTRREAFDLIHGHLPAVSRFLAVSHYYADFMGSYLGIPKAKIEVVPLGISVDGYAPAPRARKEPFTVGYFARVDPAKGLDRLCTIYRRLRQELGLPSSKLRAAGYLGEEHKSYLAACERQMRDAGLGDEFEYLGEVDRDQKIAFLSSLDVLSVPTVYVEPKGMFVLEAMACGVPVVQPRLGAFPEILERTGGGLLVGNDDRAIADGILALQRDPARAAELGQQAAAGVRAHYSAPHMAARALEVFQAVVAEPESRLRTAVSA
jgi:glycosyltransferase involved in cell wall biosynthesis